ncbi:MAG: hypothetical protein V3T70_10645, partial [Phycisphaerae bacterium]
MSQAMTAPPTILDAAALVTDARGGRVAWRCVPEFRAVIQALGIDWLDLRPAPGLTRVKHNAQRSVWRVCRGDVDVFAKAYRPNGAASRLKLWFRGPTAAQEWNVGRYAATCGLPAVRPLACGWIEAHPRTGPS